MGSEAWSCPFSDYDVETYVRDMRVRYGPNVVIEYKTLKYAFLLGSASGDIGNAAGPLVLDVLGRAADIATAAGPVDSTAANSGTPGAVTTRPQEPVLGNGGTLPQGTSILIGGIGVVVMMPLIVAPGSTVTPEDDEFAAALAADDALNGVQAAFDCGMYTLSDARNQKCAVSGHEAVSYGSSRVAVFGPPLTTVDGEVASLLYSGQVSAKDRGWARISPAFFDGGGAAPGGATVAASQLKVQAFIPRSTAWPLGEDADRRFRVEVLLPSLIAYQGANGAFVCDPATGLPVRQTPVVGGGSNQRIQPPARW